MINRLIGGFVGILIGVSLVDPVAQQVNLCAKAGTCYTALNTTTTWAPTVLALVPGFFALGILGIGLAVTYGSLRDAGVV